MEAVAPSQEDRHHPVQDQVQQREQARKRRDFAAADRIRQELSNRGATVKDSPQGPQITYRPK